MQKLPYGISNYEELITDNYYYIDKTMYIEKIENMAEKRIMFLRPRKFGKTLFTSTLECYYDKNKKEEFEKLFKGTYIYNNPTPLKNTYSILRFNFSGIDTSTVESTISGFKSKVISSIRVFISMYSIDFYINETQTAEDILNDLFKAFYIQKNGEKIYVLIDEYDHFANELLGFNTNNFKMLVSKNGKVRKWYEVLKEGTETVVDRIFITGVAPITLDSLTSGFNICSDKTMDREFNEMLGFTNEEIMELLKAQNISDEKQRCLLPMLKENYDGYKFAVKGKENIYNSNMCLYFINEYTKYQEIPAKLIDMNIASDYSKLAQMLNLCQSENRLEILKKTISQEGVMTEITEKFNPEVDFGEKEFCSMLYYLGYLTIAKEELGYPVLKVPNKIMQELYSEYFMKIMGEGLSVDLSKDYTEIVKEIALEGKINKMVELVRKYLQNLSNRDFQRFDEKYVKLIFYCISMNLKLFITKSEMEVQRNYPDLLLIPFDKTKGYKSVMIEFKYLKKDESSKLNEKMQEAKEQLKRYSEYEEIKAICGLRKYAIIAVVDDIYVEEI